MCVFVLREEKSFLIKDILYLNSLLIGGKGENETFCFKYQCLSSMLQKRTKGIGRFVKLSSTRVGSLDGTMHVLWERKRVSAAGFLGNGLETVTGLRVGFFYFHSGSKNSTFPFVSFPLVIIQLAQISRFFCFAIALCLDGSC